MKYIIMCGGTYPKWETPRQLVKIRGEPIVARTVRLLREAGVEDIAISSNDEVFEQFGVPVLEHENRYSFEDAQRITGYWSDAFYPEDHPVCYIFGDVAFSPEAIRIIVETETTRIQFFASAPPFAPEYIKRWAEPFALKVAEPEVLKEAIRTMKKMDRQGVFYRRPIIWELWSIITGRDPNVIDYGSYVAINDYTCDVDEPEDAARIEKQM